MNSASLKDDKRDSAASLAYSKRMKDAALKYHEAMSTKESRDQLIED